MHLEGFGFDLVEFGLVLMSLLVWLSLVLLHFFMLI